jgi:uncharacterized SAM-binding protein YcdF (DUF218 family)
MPQSPPLPQAPYDAIVVLGGGLRKVAGRFYPTDYRDADPFGLCGGGMRVLAAVELHGQGAGARLLFSTGVSQKTRAVHGEHVPTEASVYAEKFLRVLRARGPACAREPLILLEERSVNTTSNLEEVLKMAAAEGWCQLAWVSSEYHVPRIEALLSWGPLLTLGAGMKHHVLSAERVVEQARPGRYTKTIARAYQGPLAQRRREAELRGLEDLRAGRYLGGENTVRS